MEDILWLSVFLLIMIIAGAIGSFFLHLAFAWHVKSQLRKKDTTELKMRNMYSTYNHVILWVYFFICGLGGAAMYLWKFRDKILTMIRAEMQKRGYKTKNL